MNKNLVYSFLAHLTMEWLFHLCKFVQTNVANWKRNTWGWIIHRSSRGCHCCWREMVKYILKHQTILLYISVCILAIIVFMCAYLFIEVCFYFIYFIIVCSSKLLKVLRLLCLISLTCGGIKASKYDNVSC